MSIPFSAIADGATPGRDAGQLALVECIHCGRARGCEMVQCPGCGAATRGKPIQVVRDRNVVNRLRRWFGLESRPLDRRA